jgi:hypothetical protein
MEFWALTLSREELLTALEPSKDDSLPFRPFNSKEISQAAPPKGFVSLMWPTDPVRINRPAIVLVPQDELVDFLAWASTFLKSIRPFTAFSRVIEFQDFELISTTEKKSFSFQGLETALAGLIIAEAIAGIGIANTANPRDLSAFVCESTFFFSFTKALMARIPTSQLEKLNGKWSFLRSITRQTHKEINVETSRIIQDVVVRVAGLVGNSSEKAPSAVIASACQEILTSGEILESTWVSLTGNWPEVNQALTEMRANRERRILYIDKIFRGAAATHEPTRLFVLGYLLSLFDGGTSINVQLLPATDNWSSILMWHGFTAGLQRGNSIESIAGGLGRRLIRDFTEIEPLLSSPRGDISLAELSIFHEGKYSIDDFHASSPNVMNVEIAPRVYSCIRWPIRVRESHQGASSSHQETWKSQQKSFNLESEDEERHRLISELGFVLDRAKSIQLKLASIPSEPSALRKKTDRRRKYE